MQNPSPRKGRGERANPVSPRKKNNRNDRCPCGSGKKYKHCHGTPEACAACEEAAKKAQERNAVEMKRTLTKLRLLSAASIACQQ